MGHHHGPHAGRTPLITVFSSKTLRIVLRKGRVPFLLLFAIATYLVPRLSFLPGIQGMQSVAQSWNLIAQVLTDLEQRCIDYHFLLRGPVPQNPGVVLLGVERTDFQASDFREEDVAASEGLRLLLEKPYPWNRKLWALLVDKLAAAGVKAVAFDFLFEPENPGDPDFRAALDRRAHEFGTHASREDGDGGHSMAGRRGAGK